MPALLLGYSIVVRSMAVRLAVGLLLAVVVVIVAVGVLGAGPDASTEPLLTGPFRWQLPRNVT